LFGASTFKGDFTFHYNVVSYFLFLFKLLLHLSLGKLASTWFYELLALAALVEQGYLVLLLLTCLLCLIDCIVA